MPLLPLDNPIQSYAWGSRSVISELLGNPTPSDRPEAELWIGAHPVAPSRVAGDGSLLDRIKADPASMLGAGSTRRFGTRLPFLLKVLAAETPLSLQAHPSKVQAEQGFAREERAGVPRTAPERNYKDDNHKPELICALTPFDALCGFRKVGETLELLRALHTVELEPLIGALANEPDAEGLRRAFSMLMNAKRGEIAALVDATIRSARRTAEAGGAYAAECRWAIRLSELYPGDPGVVSALLLNLVRLEPGQALYLPEGNLHAYLHGAGIEIMANSDNVLRGGLTPKHVDVPELLRVLDFDDRRIEPLSPEPRASAEVAYRTPAAEFELSRIDLDGRASFTSAERCGPEILLCTSGHAKLPDGTDLVRGRSVFVTASEGAYELGGEGVVFRATLSAH